MRASGPGAPHGDGCTCSLCFTRPAPNWTDAQVEAYFTEWQGEIERAEEALRFQKSEFFACRRQLRNLKRTLAHYEAQAKGGTDTDAPPF